MTNTTEHKPFRRWPLYLIASPAAVAVWSGWVGLGGKTGFGPTHLFPGVSIFGLSHFVLNTAITLPVGVEAYGAYALGAWLHPATPKTAKNFARRSAIGSLLLGMLGQVAYHLMVAAHVATAPWWITMLVACLPVVTLGFGAGLTHLLREGEADAEEDTESDDVWPQEIASEAARPPMFAAWPQPDEEPAKDSATAQAPRGQSRYFRRARRYVKRSPGITGEELGAKLGVSDRHGRRILAEVKEAMAAEEASTNLTVDEPATEEEPVAA